MQVIPPMGKGCIRLPLNLFIFKGVQSPVKRPESHASTPISVKGDAGNLHQIISWCAWARWENQQSGTKITCEIDLLLLLLLFSFV